ncbi:MAG: phytoene desaturase [Acidimicrobiales bacterium]|nr:phytoene desaturase [Acidimicrobiales bacterium]
MSDGHHSDSVTRTGTRTGTRTDTSTDSTVVVIGAGLAGLSAACHLRGAGRSVVVVEAGDAPGGRAGVTTIDGYTFETGPTVLTMPEIIRECFDALGIDMDSMLSLSRLDPMYRACYADGSEIRLRQGRAAMTEEIRSTCGERDAQAFAMFSDRLEELYRLELPNFIDRNVESPLSLLRPVGPALALLRSGAFRRLEPMVKRFFEDERLVRLFSFQALYAGLAPQQALAIYAVITYMDSVNGVFHARGGMHAVPIALEAAATAAGVKFRYGQRIDSVLLAEGSRGAVRGVRLEGGETIETGRVVCTVDLPTAYRTLVPGIRAPRPARRGTYSPSALVWHLGVRGDLPSGVAHHNIHFGGEWSRSFEQLLDDGTRMADPSLLVTVPTIEEPWMAPPDRNVLYVLEPVPNLDGRIDWTRERQPARDRLMRMLDQHGYPTNIEVEVLVDPLDWQAQGLERGTPFSLSHRFFQTGPFRPPNTEARAPGLVFAGAATVPGVGVPMVLISGKLAAQRIIEMDPS